MPPLEHPLNLQTQAIMTYGSWFLALTLLAFSVLQGRRRRTWFPFILVLASAIAALAEPLYDLGFRLLFFIPGQWTLFTYANIPQPVWTVSGYMILYAGPAVLMCDRFERGLRPAEFLAWAVATFLISSAFEIYGIQGGAYSYWGSYELRVFGYPLVVGILETTFVMLFSVLAYVIRKRLGEGLPLLATLALFPAVFYGVNFGLGAPTLIALGLTQPAPAWVMAGTLVSIAASVSTILALSRYVALPSRTSARPSLRGLPDAHAH